MSDIEHNTTLTMDLPGHLVKKKIGIAIDFGGSVIKIIHTEPIAENIRLHFKSYPCEEIDEAFQYINMIIKHLGIEKEYVIPMTGAGHNQYQSQMRAALGYRTTCFMEINCFVNGFLFIKNNFTNDEIQLPRNIHIENSAKNIVSKRNNAWKKVTSGGMKPLRSWSDDANDDANCRATPDPKPIILAICGSVTSILKITSEDGEFEYPGFSPISGKTLLAAGSLLTGAKTYEELTDLAEKGLSDKMNTSDSDIENTDVYDVYTRLTGGIELFTWGKAVGKEINSFTREDRAAAVVSLVTQSVAAYTHQWAHICDVQHVYFCGSLHANSTVVRESLEKYSNKQSLMYPLGGQQMLAHFLRHGAYLGALGALLEHLGRVD